MENCPQIINQNLKVHISKTLIFRILDYFQIFDLENLVKEDKLFNKDHFEYTFNRKCTTFTKYSACHLKQVKDVFKKAETLNWPVNGFDIYTNQKGEDIAVFCDSFRYLYQLNIKNDSIMKKVPSEHLRIVLSVRHFRIKGKDYIVTTSKDCRIFLRDENLTIILFNSILHHGSDSFVISPLLFQLPRDEPKDEEKLSSKEEDENNLEWWNCYFVTIGHMSKEMSISSLNLFSSEGEYTINKFVLPDKVLGMESYTHENKVYLLPFTSSEIQSYVNADKNFTHNRSFYTSNNSIESICFQGDKLIAAESSLHINIWDFFTGEILRVVSLATFKENKLSILTVNLWCENVLILGCGDATFRIVDLNSEETFKIYECWGTKVGSIRKVNHSEYGPCLYVYNDSTITLWA